MVTDVWVAVHTSCKKTTYYCYCFTTTQLRSFSSRSLREETRRGGGGKRCTHTAHFQNGCLTGLRLSRENKGERRAEIGKGERRERQAKGARGERGETCERREMREVRGGGKERRQEREDREERGGTDRTKAREVKEEREEAGKRKERGERWVM